MWTPCYSEFIFFYFFFAFVYKNCVYLCLWRRSIRSFQVRSSLFHYNFTFIYFSFRWLPFFLQKIAHTIIRHNNKTKSGKKVKEINWFDMCVSDSFFISILDFWCCSLHQKTLRANIIIFFRWVCVAIRS